MALPGSISTLPDTDPDLDPTGSGTLNKRIISSVHDQNKTNVIIYLRTGLLYLHCSYDESSMNDKLRKTSRTFVAISTMYKK